jgi:signal transduction histidine kinase
MKASIEVETRLSDLAAERTRLANDLRRAKVDLEQSARRFRDVIERNADAIVVVDQDGAIRFANSMASKLFGASREDLLNKPFGFPLVAGETTEIDLRSRGEPRTAEMRVVQSEWEGATAYIASLRDITERRRAEENQRQLIREQAARTAAEDAARRLRFLLDTSTALAASLDYDTTLSVLARVCVPAMADWAVVYGVGEKGQLRRLEVAHPDPSKANTVRELRDATIDQGGPNPVLTALRTGKSLLVPATSMQLLEQVTENARQRELVRDLGFESLMIVPMISHERALAALALVSASPARRFDHDDLALAEDVARRATLAMESARLYEEARRANAGKADFLAVVSHDLRTPLTAIIGYAELLELGVPEALPRGARQPIRRIQTSAKHLLYLLNELLAFARLDAGREEARLQEIDLRDVGAEVVEVVEPLAVARGLEFHVLMPNDPVIAVTDPNKLRQILLNLLGNATKYTDSGRISLELDVTQSGVQIRVRDTGVGIAPEHLTHIFEPFWQVDSTRRSKDGGTGLGLSVVERLVRLLSAELTVASEPGVGTTFTLTLSR